MSISAASTSAKIYRVPASGVAPQSPGQGSSPSLPLPELDLLPIMSGWPAGGAKAEADAGGAAQAPGGGGDDAFKETVMTLGRHEKLLRGKIDAEKLDGMLADDSLPSDLRGALQTLQEDPGMFDRLESAKTGERDGRFSVKDVRTLQDSPEMKAYTDQRAEAYLDNYTPSDAVPGTPGRRMTANDAMRELFRYGDSLPNKFGLEDLQKIADGSANAGKAPPALMAAAKYYTRNPGEWSRLTGEDANGKIGRERFADLASRNVQLRPEELEAVKTLADNRDVFFKKGGLTPDKLQQIVQDPSNSDAVREAAALLGTKESMLFGMLENAKHGAGGDAWNTANDKNLSKNDLKAFLKQGLNEASGDDRNASLFDQASAEGPLGSQASADMAVGQESQPDAKKQKGGQLKDVLTGLAQYVLPSLLGGVGGFLASAAGRIAGLVGGRVAGQVAGKAMGEVAQQSLAMQPNPVANQATQGLVADNARQDRLV